MKGLTKMTIKNTALLAIATLSLMATSTYADMQLFFIHNDHLGTPQVVTDENQSVVWSADYRPFGEVNVTTNAIDQEARFPGQYTDDQTGLHYNYFRDYDPTIGRYIQSDPIGLGDGVNVYGYVHSSPMNYYDPNGETAIHLGRGALWVGGRIGAGINAGIRVASGGRTLGTIIYDTVHGDSIPGSDSRDEARDDADCPPPGDNDDKCDMKFEREVYYGGDTKTCQYREKGGIFTFPQDKELPCMPVDKKRCLVDTSFMGPKARGIYGR